MWSRGGAHRVAGPVGLLLHGDLDAVGQLARRAGAAARRRPRSGPPPPRCAACDRPADHRPPADRVQDLRRLGPHARALARGEDQHGGSGHAEHRSIGPGALGGGLMARHRFLVPADGGSIPLPPVRPIGSVRTCVRVRPSPSGSANTSFGRRSAIAHRVIPTALRALGLCGPAAATVGRSRSTCDLGHLDRPLRPRRRAPRRLRTGRRPSRWRSCPGRGLDLPPRAPEAAALRRTASRIARCELCGQGEMWRGAEMALILDHVNGVATTTGSRTSGSSAPTATRRLTRTAAAPTGDHLALPPAPQCGSAFRPKSLTHRYCSRDCGQRQGGGSAASRRASSGPAGSSGRPTSSSCARSRRRASAVGRKYGVSDNAVRKWVRWYEAELDAA